MACLKTKYDYLWKMIELKNKLTLINLLFRVPGFLNKNRDLCAYLACSALGFLCLFLSSCGSGDEELPVPKPAGYFRIEFPEKNYIPYDSTCPFSFQYPDYGTLGPDIYSPNEPCWINVNFPRFRGTLHLSYKKIENNLGRYLNESRELAVKHQIKASYMNDVTIRNDSANVYGLVYEIGGNAASPLQFYLTDSTRHFIRGALYFNARPNRDSIEPVFQFIKKDMEMLIGSLSWK